MNFLRAKNGNPGTTRRRKSQETSNRVESDKHVGSSPSFCSKLFLANVLMWTLAALCIGLVIVHIVARPVPFEILELRDEIKQLQDDISAMEELLQTDSMVRAEISIQDYCYLTDPNGAPQCRPCKKNYKYYNGMCYMFHQDPMTFDEAAAACQSDYTNLALVPSKGVWDFICSNTPEVKGTTGSWIGLRNTGIHWVWLNGSLLNFHVIMFQISPEVFQQCAIVESGNCVHGFTTVNCTTKQSWICETAALSL